MSCDVCVRSVYTAFASCKNQIFSSLQIACISLELTEATCNQSVALVSCGCIGS